MTPFVVAGGIVRNRAWILPRHLSTVALNNPAQMFYVTGDNKDETVAVLNSGTITFPTYEKRHLGPTVEPDTWFGVPLSYLVHDTSEPGYTRDGSDGPRYRSAHMAAERNLWASEALKRWPQASHLWVVDSDVLPEPDVLEKLLVLKAPVAAAFVPIGDGVTPIAMGGWDFGLMRPRRDGTERAKQDPWAATLVGGAYLVQKHVFLRGHDYPWSEHPQGEDGGFAAYCRREGFEMLHHPGARCRHIFNRDDG